MSATIASITPLVEQLNTEQREAVLHRGGPVLVLAGAGTGKTRVITVRIAHMLAHGMIPEHVLALTFTNKAAGEMAERVAGYVGADQARAMTIGTFHSLGLKMLEQHGERLGFNRGIRLLDAADQGTAVRHCLKQLRIDPKRHDPRSFLTTISNARNARLTPEALAARGGNRLAARVYGAYLQWLEAYQVMDFDDLILRPVQLLEEHDDLRDYWRHRFRTILVDEYQDTNPMQFELIRMLSEEHRSLCVVGDDDQSIYGWRGATIENILGFKDRFPDATSIALTQNYRSTGAILDAANAVIRNNTTRMEKALWTSGGEGEKVQVVTCRDPGAEASFVAAELRRRHDSEHRNWRDFGVLFRTAKQAQPLEDALRLAAVPYKLIGAFAFFERKEVKDMLSYLRLVLNPHDEISLMRIINFPQRGIGPKALGWLRTEADRKRGSLWDAVVGAADVAALNKKQKAGMAELVVALREARKLDRDSKDLAGLIMFLSEKTRAREAWIRDPTEGPGGMRRWKTIEALHKSVARWQHFNPDGTLKDYLRLVALDGKSTAVDEETDEVTLLTLHASKGLEWPICFMVGCQEGLIPHQRTLEDPRADVSEERRLFYVGITRAKRTCFLTLSQVRRRFHGTEPTRPSRFLAEIPPESRVDVDRAKGAGTVDRSEQKRRFSEIRDRLRKR